jgi:hypothetical protein
VDAAAVAAESPLPTLHWFVQDTNGAMYVGLYKLNPVDP